MTCQRMLASVSGTTMLPGSPPSPPQATMQLAKHRHHIRSQNSNGKQPVDLLTKNLRSCKGHNMQIIASTFISFRWGCLGLSVWLNSKWVTQTNDCILACIYWPPGYYTLLSPLRLQKQMYLHCSTDHKTHRTAWNSYICRLQSFLFLKKRFSFKITHKPFEIFQATEHYKIFNYCVCICWGLSLGWLTEFGDGLSKFTSNFKFLANNNNRLCWARSMQSINNVTVNHKRRATWTDSRDQLRW